MRRNTSWTSVGTQFDALCFFFFKVCQSSVADQEDNLLSKFSKVKPISSEPGASESSLSSCCMRAVVDLVVLSWWDFPLSLLSSLSEELSLVASVWLDFEGLFLEIKDLAPLPDPPLFVLPWPRRNTLSGCLEVVVVFATRLDVLFLSCDERVVGILINLAELLSWWVELGWIERGEPMVVKWKFAMWRAGWGLVEPGLFLSGKVRLFVGLGLKYVVT